jgi:glyoxylase I family protein
MLDRQQGVRSANRHGLVLLFVVVPMTIDLLECLEPRDEAAPYPHLYHYGLARIALWTTDLAGDMANLKAAGATFLSEPAAMPPSSGVEVRFVCFKDPDGTILELVEKIGS